MAGLPGERIERLMIFTSGSADSEINESYELSKYFGKGIIDSCHLTTKSTNTGRRWLMLTILIKNTISKALNSSRK